MSRRRHTEAQIIAAPKQVEVGCRTQDVAREIGVSTYTAYAWKVPNQIQLVIEIC